MNLNNIINRIKSINPNIKFLGSFNKNNKKTGYWEGYYFDGNIQSKGNYINGKKDGYWEEYYHNGNLWYTGSYKNGMKDGYWVNYWYDSKIKYEMNYSNNKLNGVFKEYYFNGQIREIKHYVNDKKILLIFFVLLIFCYTFVLLNHLNIIK
jgi:antitoxin component YwqK of YwqJK toxin-antitoxin module